MKTSDNAFREDLGWRCQWIRMIASTTASPGRFEMRIGTSEAAVALRGKEVA